LAANLSGHKSAIVSKRLNIHLDQKISIAKKYQLVPKTFGHQLKFCKEHKIDRKMLISYVNLEQKLIATPPNYFGKVKKLNSTTKTMHTGRKTFYPEAEAWLYSKFVEYRDKDWPVSNRLLQVLAMQKYPDIYNENIGAERDELIKGWIYRFRERFNIVVRRKTHMSSGDNELEMANVVIDYVQYFRRIQDDYHVPWKLCFNMDQTALDLTDLFQTTLEREGKLNFTRYQAGRNQYPQKST
jgi:hypothetical protein